MLTADCVGEWGNCMLTADYVGEWGNCVLTADCVGGLVKGGRELH